MTTVKGVADFSRNLRALASSDWCAIDTETTGLDPWGTEGIDRVCSPSRLFMVTVCNHEGETGWLSFQVDARTRTPIYSEREAYVLKDFMENAKELYAHNAPYDRRMLRYVGCSLHQRWNCTRIGMSVISSNELTYKLKPLCKKFFGIPEDDLKELIKSVIGERRALKASGLPVADDVEADFYAGRWQLVRDYAVRDAHRCAHLAAAQIQHFSEHARAREVYTREMDLMLELERMEDRGVSVDPGRISSLHQFYSGIMKRHSNGIPPGLNPKSPKQLQMEFFGRQKLKPIRYSSTKSGAKRGQPVKCSWCNGLGCAICQDSGKNPKCDGEFLESVGVLRVNGEPIPGNKLAWDLLHSSAASTMLSYISQYRDLAVYDSGDVLCIHPNFLQTGARTARMSCERPNLQNVASDASGKKRVDIPYRTREVFVPRPGYMFYLADWSQIEVWVLALLSKDPEFIQVLASGGDAHQNVADLVWGHLYDAKAAKQSAKLRQEQLTSSQAANLKAWKSSRKKAKNLQFCKIYGGGVSKIASMIGCSIGEAKRFVEDYDRRLPFVSRFMDETVRAAKRDGIVVNPYGREYAIDPGYEYRATNYLIQGSAAEIAKNSTIRLGQMFRKKNVDAHLLLQIHDEFLIEVAMKDDSPQLRRDIVKAMGSDSSFLGCPVPFPVGFQIATTRWSEAVDVEVKP